MTAAHCHEMELLVQADLDGELEALASATLATHLEGCAGCSALQTELKALSGDIRNSLTRHSAPAALRAAVLQQTRPMARRRVHGGWSHGAAFGAGLAIAASVALAILPSRNDPMLDIVAAHVRALQPGHLTDVESTDQHTVKPWFNGRLDFSPPVRNLAAQRFPLLGGRLDVLAGRPVAVLVYGRDKHLIDVFISPGDRTNPQGQVQGYNVVSWAQGGMTFQAVSDLNTKELGEFAELLRAPSS